MAISILELTYLQMFSLAEIHGRLHRPEAGRSLSLSLSPSLDTHIDIYTLTPTYRLVQD